jgi:hypothetical protein
VKTNVLTFVSAVCGTVEHPIRLLPCVLMSLPNSILFERASWCLRSFPLMNKALKGFLSFLIRQLQSIRHDEHSLRTIFESSAKNRQLLDEVCSSVHTAAGCRSFWRLTNDVGVVETIRRFPEEPMTVTFFQSVIEKFHDQGLEEWAFETSNSFLIRDAICYSNFNRIESILFIVSVLRNSIRIRSQNTF